MKLLHIITVCYLSASVLACGDTVTVDADNNVNNPSLATTHYVLTNNNSLDISIATADNSDSYQISSISALYGHVEANAGMIVTYQPNNLFWGKDTITLELVDAKGNTSEHTVLISYVPKQIDLSSLTSQLNEDAHLGYVIDHSARSDGAMFGISLQNAGDINGDGLNDFIAGYRTSSPFDVYDLAILGNSNVSNNHLYDERYLDAKQSSFNEALKVDKSTYAIGDIDGDGYADLLSGNTVIYGSQSIQSLLTTNQLQAEDDYTSLNFALDDTFYVDNCSIQTSATTALRQQLFHPVVMSTGDTRFSNYLKLKLATTDQSYLVASGAIPKNTTVDLSNINDSDFVRAIPDYSTCFIGGLNASIFQQNLWAIDPLTYSLFEVDLNAVTRTDFKQNELAFSESIKAANFVADINGDSHNDFVLMTRTQLFINTQASISSLSDMQTSPSSADGVTISLDSNLLEFGAAATTVGDINNDGFNDFAFQVLIYNRTSKVHRADTVILWGSSVSSSEQIAIDLNDDNTIELSVNNYVVLQGYQSITNYDSPDYLGSRIAAVGDINGDGIDDFVVSAPAYHTKLSSGDSSLAQGRLSVLYGGQHWSQDNE